MKAELGLSWIDALSSSTRSFGDRSSKDIFAHILVLPSLFLAKQIGNTFIPGDRVLK